MIDRFLRIFTRVAGSRNERVLKRLQPLVEAIGALEADLEKKTDAELRATTDVLRARLRDGETLDDILVDAFALVREMSKRTPPPGGDRGLRHYDVQLIGGMVLHQGKIAEMATGEGKTLVATLPVYLNALTGKGVHVITVNDYLARRDREWMGPIYEKLGLSVGVIQADMDNSARRQAYACDITYGTNNEFGFDYLRDNMKSSLSEQVQRRSYAVLDEVDNILIDEARTPLIISGPSEGGTARYGRADSIVRRLKKGTHFEIKEKEQQATLTEEGVDRAQELLGVDTFYSGKHMEWPHLLEQALRAHHLFENDVDYVVEMGDRGTREVVIIDEFTGRKMAGRRWSDGLHQAVEAKERIPIRAENQTLATITFQNFFKLYDKLAGMTGTAMTEAGEFLKIYHLDVVAIPTNRPKIRDDQNDLIYATEKDKFNAVIDDIKERHEEGRPVLVGTTSIEKSERLSGMLQRRGIPHEVLNAKQHQREAEIVEHAGQAGRVTIATNMAGRGTDIKLGEGVREAGGLHVLGTERHESRRIDNQLRGRGGRQGDPGTSRFYLSLDDDLMRRFAGDRVRGLLTKMGLQGSEAIEHRWVTGAVEKAQKKVEDRNFEIRKSLLEYDGVMNEQRTLVYDHRQQILRGEDLRGLCLRMVNQALERAIDEAMPEKAGQSEWEWDRLEGWYWRKTRQPAPDRSAIEEGPRERIQEVYAESLEHLLDQRARRHGPEVTAMIARFVLLNAFDGKWKEHLYNMDALKGGINLRSYGNEDPKVAYKREGYVLFEEMLRSIEEEVSGSIYLLEPAGEERREELETEDRWGGAQARHDSLGESNRDDMEAAAYRAQGADEEPAKPFKREAAKVGRNDPCPCGSGKKFKKCCGQVKV